MKTTILTALLVLASCDSGDSGATAPPEPAPGDEVETEEQTDEETAAVDPETIEIGDATPQDATAFASSTRTFAADLWQQLRGREGNLAVSPASISTAMAMTWAGANGETAEQIARTLRFGDDATAIHRAAHAQLASWNDPNRESYELRVANRLFAKEGLPLEPEFVALTRDAYLAPIESLSFTSDPEAARERINGWVEEQTNQRIEDLLPQGSIDATTRLVLTNAVYFHGAWTHRFSEDATEDRPFHLGGGEDASVPTMQITERFGYARTDDVQLLEMPYVGDELSMLVVLPTERDGLAAVEASLDAAALEAWANAPSTQRVNVLLPRFRIDPPESIALKPALSEMGMPLAFQSDADFTAMSDPQSAGERLFIADVYHQAFVEVNEEGTEAAAATGAVMRVTSAAPPQDEPPTFHADHPFLFLLRDQRTGAILFMGRVVDPR